MNSADTMNLLFNSFFIVAVNSADKHFPYKYSQQRKWCAGKTPNAPQHKLKSF